MFSFHDSNTTNTSNNNENTNSLSMMTLPMKKNRTPPNIYTQMNHHEMGSSSSSSSNSSSNHFPISNMTTVLENLVTEKQKNKTETWNKLNKTIKIQKLNIFADKYGKEHDLSSKDVRLLKSFFIDCLEKGKLQKVKDVLCDKETRDIVSIPSLAFNIHAHNFTLRTTDTKRVSTLKSLPPKRSPLVETVELPTPPMTTTTI
jgi:hypothetical protein